MGEIVVLASHWNWKGTTESTLEMFTLLYNFKIHMCMSLWTFHWWWHYAMCTSCQYIHITIRITAYCMWLYVHVCGMSRFIEHCITLLYFSILQLGSNRSLKVHFLPLCVPNAAKSSTTDANEDVCAGPLFITASVDEVTNLTVIQFYCDSMDLVGEVIQNLAKYFQMSELNSIANFPTEFDKFEEVRRLFCMSV